MNAAIVGGAIGVCPALGHWHGRCDYNWSRDQLTD